MTNYKLQNDVAQFSDTELGNPTHRTLKHESSKKFKHIQKFQSHRDTLVKHHQTYESYFDTIARSYGTLRWWSKLLMFTGVVSIGGYIGILFHLIAIFAVITLVVYTLITLLLEYHHSTLLKRDQNLENCVNECEKSLAESVEHMSHLEDQLQRVYLSLCEMNQEQTHDIALFQEQTQRYGKQMDALTELNNKLGTTHASLASSSQNVDKTLTQAKFSIEHLNTTLSNEIKNLGTLNHQLIETNLLFSQDHQQLENTTLELNDNSQEISSLSAKLANLLEQLEKQINAYETLYREVSEKLNLLLYENLEAQKNTEEMVAHTEDILEETVQLVTEYQSEQVEIDQKSSLINTISTSNKTTELLERAAKLLAQKSIYDAIVPFQP